VNVDSVSHCAKELAWVRPANSVVLALTTEAPPSRSDWQQLLLDPAFVAHLLRFARPSLSPEYDSLKTELVLQPAIPLQAAAMLEQTPRSATLSAEVQRTFSLAADFAKQLAAPEHLSWAIALTQLPALGWLAKIQAGDIVSHPLQVSQQLLARWRVPSWITATITGLSLLPADAERIGAPAELFQIVQTALATAEAQTQPLGITNSNASIACHLKSEQKASEPIHQLTICDELLIRLLRQTAAARRTSTVVWLHEAEKREQKLLSALAQARAEFADQVQEARLSGLAEFAAGASHEINNPLAVISGHAQLLLHGEADAARQRQLNTIIRQTRRIDELLHGTRQFARPSRPKPIRFALNEWEGDLLSLFQHDLQSKKLTWQCELQEDTFGFGDAVQLRQALIHLVRNAIEASPPEGVVRVRGAYTQGHLVVEVFDNGPGPSAEQQPHLFDPFFSGRSAGRGRGLGLSIAWRLVSINNGTVRFVGHDNGWTCFRLELPSSNVQTQPVQQFERRSA
jgi:two-component system, NtrC family, sensor kinase